jgi:glycosyltransferase involved in cell wall biosynthesis
MLAVETPKLSVVMPVHNAMPYLDAAVKSILAQSFRDFEFVILDDASTDGSTERLREWARKDDRIRLFEVPKNLGPAASSNDVVKRASAPLIARMDADDVSHPDRLSQQIALLRQRPDVGLVGSLCENIDGEGRSRRGPERWRLARKCPFAPFPHGSIMFRREVFDLVGGYRNGCEFWEDLDLILRFSAAANILVVPYALYRHRQSTSSTRLASNQDRVEKAVDLMFCCVDRLREGGSYDDLLVGRRGHSGPIDPRVFISLGSTHLWGGGTPRLFKRLLRHGKLQPNVSTLAALVWTAWASAEPRSLRGFIRLLLFAREARAALTVRTDAPVLWPAPTAGSAVSLSAVPAE